MIRYYAECLAKHGRAITPDHVVAGASVYVADSREQALKEAGPYILYFFHTLFSHGNLANSVDQGPLNRIAKICCLGLSRRASPPASRGREAPEAREWRCLATRPRL